MSLSYATYGIVTRDGVVIETAPIARWMIGKDISYVRRWVAGKRGTIQEI